MTTSETIGAIAPALIKAQSQMQGIIKEGKNPAFRSKYVTLDSILDTLRPILTSNGLMLTQGSQQPETLSAVTVESRIIHTSGEWIATTVTIPVTKPDAHGLGSALTYGRRYSVSALLAISADEDDDANGAVTPQDGFRRGPQGNIVIDEPVRPTSARAIIKMTFGQVYQRLWEGMAIRRKGWESGKVVRLSTISGNHLMIHLPNKNLAVYCPLVVDLYDKEQQKVRDDWEVVR